jgi:uncharacterized Fe-S cluster protein YjdI/CDGSH-type Zn-finger protein
LPATRTYQNKDIIIYWYPDLCIHVRHCANILPAVFRPEARPWVNVDGASALETILAIDRCPSGALRYSLPEGSSIHPAAADGPGRQHEGGAVPAVAMSACEGGPPVTITASTNGPLLTEGPARLVGPQGEVLAEAGRLTLCRCGHSANRPFCDGAHLRAGWHVDDEHLPR